ncbi:uncharacterized protein LOC115634359 [Scaptodrosophila lebanonensis]|uniref:Uncharacterized protein LOC115634359 n=1 Tax=Drosophila lebanonensis TaxID=7225 RepID=A0A6J2UI89_DROLE|nr:uncharacterized protein LOC115634359 [Scaptodrosophila lebanonensis]
MGNSLSRQRSVGSSQFWRFVYWFVVLLVVGLIMFGLVHALKADFGQCSDFDMRCD